jgi:hypothetical protein
MSKKGNLTRLGMRFGGCNFFPHPHNPNTCPAVDGLTIPAAAGAASKKSTENQCVKLREL